MNYMFLYFCTLLTSTYVSWLKKNLIPKRNWMKWSYGSITMPMNFQKKCRLTKQLSLRIWNLLLKATSCRLNNVWATIRWPELLDCSNKSERTLKTINDILLLFNKKIKIFLSICTIAAKTPKSIVISWQWKKLDGNKCCYRASSYPIKSNENYFILIYIEKNNQEQYSDYSKNTRSHSINRK